jgi:hypothetical protein
VWLISKLGHVYEKFKEEKRFRPPERLQLKNVQLRAPQPAWLNAQLAVICSSRHRRSDVCGIKNFGIRFLGLVETTFDLGAQRKRLKSSTKTSQEPLKQVCVKSEFIKHFHSAEIHNKKRAAAELHFDIASQKSFLRKWRERLNKFGGCRKCVGTLLSVNYRLCRGFSNIWYYILLYRQREHGEIFKPNTIRVAEISNYYYEILVVYKKYLKIVCTSSKDVSSFWRFIWSVAINFDSA